jgi:1-acyl-sn-glycerol-3-phosphate acyltransferase
MNFLKPRLRTLLFFASAFLWTVLITVCGTVLLILPRIITVHYLRMWASVVIWLLRVVADIKHEIRGVEHLQELWKDSRPALFLCGHQSAWETIIFHLLVRDPCFFMKKELMRIPFYGWLAWKVGMISISRDRSTTTLRKLIDQCFPRALDLMKRGQSIIFFPAGTRVPVGQKQELHLFVHKLYERVSRGGFQTYVVALNSGACWPRDGDLHPGEITLCIESIPAGLKRVEFGKAIQGINTIQSFLPHGARQEELSGINFHKTSRA